MAIRKIISRSIQDSTIATSDLADGVGGSNIKVYSVTPQTVSGASGVSVAIVGEGFINGATVHFISAATGTVTAAGSVTFNSAVKLTVTTPQLTVSDEPWSVRVTNPNGQSAAIESILDAGNAPAWSTAAGQVGSDTVQSSSFSTTVAASDADGQSITYSESGTDVLTGSGSGKLNFTLNSTTGAITGTMPSLGSDTTFNFTLGASDGVNLTTRNFNIVGKAGTPTVNYLYGGVVTATYNSAEATGSANAGSTTLYGISGGSITSGFRSHGSANYSDNERTAYTTGYSGHSGASSQGSSEIFTAQGNEAGRYYFKCGGSGSTGVGISVGWYTGRLYIPSDHDRMRIEFNAHSYSSNNSSTGGDIEFRLLTSVSSTAYAFTGTNNTSTASPAGGSARLGAASNYGGKATGARQFDANIDASVINGSSHQLAFFASGGQYSASAGSVYRVATYNSALGLA